MKKQTIVFSGLLHAVAATLYIGLVVFVMSHANTWFGPHDGPLTGMMVMMLFVLSAAIMGSLIFLRPVMWYHDGKKREALALLGWTIGFFFILTLAVFAYTALFYRPA